MPNAAQCGVACDRWRCDGDRPDAVPVRHAVHSDASLVAPFIYATLIFVMLFDFGVLVVVPDLISLAGAGVIITCGSYIAIREHRQGTS